ncbi:type II toxin-antitoxin system RelE/ParE family toxin [Iodobacter ciconiae]|uniref:Type II toxin-antitoxin system RelE/ParE family toxin n=1 Tax=Iodobacter ciconiae TaxID=2496266 RepID=A0A3S8ZX92_9NEIS|nr:type II toxin-antitoxin system RelE/ParE family toxin [Iodobacter ciconiae]
MPFFYSVVRLADHPKLGLPGKIQGTRELIPHECYCLVYEISGEPVWMLALVHTACQWALLRN